jgi:glutathione S-transferase
MKYQLYYWPGLPGRGEFVRLALEEAGADYVDVARDEESGGIEALLAFLGDNKNPTPPFAPPFLKAGKLVIGQTANILMYLGRKHRLAPANDAGRLFANQLQLTVTDFVKEVHDTHHPLASNLYYEDQKPEARRYTEIFLKERMPKYLGYFERVLSRAKGKKFLIGGKLTYPDLSMFELVEGLRYAFSDTMRRAERRYPLIVALHDRVAERPRIKKYRASNRCIPFNESGIFRHYPELDG